MKKEKLKTYENFPLWMVLIASTFSILTYVLGAYILFQASIWLMLLYLAYCAWMEIKVLKNGCVNCYYYGKYCGFGRGKLCSKLFEKGKPENFCKRDISWVELIPDFLVSIIPILTGIVLLIIGFRWSILIIIALLLIFMSAGNALIRGKLACKFCKQRELGCPAEKLFGKKN